MTFQRRRLVALLAPILLPALVGCRAERPRADEGVPPFVFRSLNLRQQDTRNRPSWELTSPEARYDLRRGLAQVRQPRGVIYREGQPLYRLEATTGTVLNDGEVILLEGAIRVRRLGRQPVLITGSRVRWIPAQQVMEIDRHPAALDPRSRLVARRARFLIDKDELRLRGNPRLERWPRPIDPFRQVPKGAPEIVLTARRADWLPGSGALRAAGPVRGRRRPEGRAEAKPPQTLSASALEGNTRSQVFLLKAPVRFDDPLDQVELLAQDVRIDAAEDTVRSEAPFRGRRGPLRVRGNAFELRGAEDLATISGDCALEQPGESLQAGTCAWNWESQDVRASGSLELRRQANDQLTRGELLQGRLGKEGNLTVTAPGGRVFSRFRLPRRPGPPQPRRPRPAPEPIRL